MNLKEECRKIEETESIINEFKKDLPENLEVSPYEAEQMLRELLILSQEIGEGKHRK